MITATMKATVIAGDLSEKYPHSISIQVRIWIVSNVSFMSFNFTQQTRVLRRDYDKT